MLAMGGHGLVAPFGDHLVKADQLYALLLESGKFSFQHVQGLRVGVADEHRRALSAGQGHALLQLRGDGLGGAGIVQKTSRETCASPSAWALAAATVAALVRLSTKNRWRRCNSAISQVMGSAWEVMRLPI